MDTKATKTYSIFATTCHMVSYEWRKYGPTIFFFFHSQIAIELYQNCVLISLIYYPALLAW